MNKGTRQKRKTRISQRQSINRFGRQSSTSRHNQRQVREPGSGFIFEIKKEMTIYVLVPPSLITPEEQCMIIEQPIDISTAMVPEIISMGDTAALRQSLDSIEAATSSLRYTV